MKNLFLFSLLLWCFASSAQQNLHHYAFGGAADDEIFSLALDHNNNVLETMVIVSDSCIISDSVTHNLRGALVSFNSSGTVNWIIPAGDGPYSWQFRFPVVKVDNNNDYYLMGEFSTTLHIRNDSLVPSGTGPNVFLAKLDANGNPLLLKRIGNNFIAKDFCIATDGSIYFTGYAYYPAVIDGDTVLTTANTTDAIVVKLDNTGNALWVNHAGGDGPYGEYGSGICLDANGNIYVGGSMRSSTNYFDSIAITLPNLYGYSGFLAKYNPAGQVLWANRCGYETVTVACDPAGNVMAGGYHFNGAVFGTDTQSVHGGGFIALFNTAGQFQWSHSTLRSDSATVSISSIRCVKYRNNQFVIGGLSTDSFYLGNLHYTDIDIHSEMRAIAAAFDVNGNGTWQYEFNHHLSSIFEALDVNECRIALAGSVRDSGAVYILNDTLVLRGQHDALLVTFDSSVFCNTQTRIQELNHDMVNVFPNPTSTELFIQSSAVITEVNIYNTLGALVMAARPQTANSKLSTVNLASGVYFVEINAVGEKVVRKVVKN